MPNPQYIDLGWSDKGDLTELHKIEHFWAKSLERTYTSKGNTPFGRRRNVAFQVFAADKEILEDISKEVTVFYRKVHQILERETTGEVENIHLFYFNLLDL